MNINKMRDSETLKEQYKNSSQIEIRKSFHKKYGTHDMEYFDWILTKLQLFDKCRMLEVGCGTGDFWLGKQELINSFSELVLSDISEGMLTKARESFGKQNNISCAVIDILDIPYEDNSFDIVIANSMLHHVTDINSALKSVVRVLKDDGTFYATAFESGGLLSYINTAMFETGLSKASSVENISFTLDNGKENLCPHFSSVTKEIYDDRLDVTDPLDIVEYIFSMSSMSHIDTSNKQKLVSYFDSKKDKNGIISIPKKYGIFICKK